MPVPTETRQRRRMNHSRRMHASELIRICIHHTDLRIGPPDGRPAATGPCADLPRKRNILAQRICPSGQIACIPRVFGLAASVQHKSTYGAGSVFDIRQKHCISRVLGPAKDFGKHPKSLDLHRHPFPTGANRAGQQRVAKTPQFFAGTRVLAVAKTTVYQHLSPI